MQIEKVLIGTLEFDCRVQGDQKNDLVILLHGFPETSIMWSRLMIKLSSLGFYCIAPDMRGYSKNACPKGVQHYTIEKLSQDILDIADSFNKKKFHLIGHDWGAAIGWSIVYNHADRIISWTGLSVPHNRAFGKAIKTDKAQRKKSRYIKWFLLPYLPEMMLRRNDYAILRKLWKHSTKEENEHYLAVFGRKESLTAALNYYRANIGKLKSKTIGDIQTPTLFIWGKNDPAVGEVAVRGNQKYMKGEYTFLELEAGHWLIQTKYAEIETAIASFVSLEK